jgi:Fe-S cluster assembly scaffold protein SufB
MALIQLFSLMDLSVIFQRRSRPMELSTYFRINQAGTGQFERTLLLLMKVVMFYLEGCQVVMKINCTQL